MCEVVRTDVTVKFEKNEFSAIKKMVGQVNRTQLGQWGLTEDERDAIGTIYAALSETS